MATPTGSEHVHEEEVMVCIDVTELLGTGSGCGWGGAKVGREGKEEC